MKSIDYRKLNYYDELKSNKKFGVYHVAKLGDIELHLLHCNDDHDK